MLELLGGGFYCRKQVVSRGLLVCVHTCTCKVKTARHAHTHTCTCKVKTARDAMVNLRREHAFPHRSLRSRYRTAAQREVLIPAVDR